MSELTLASFYDISFQNSVWKFVWNSVTLGAGEVQDSLSVSLQNMYILNVLLNQISSLFIKEWYWNYLSGTAFQAPTLICPLKHPLTL